MRSRATGRRRAGMAAGLAWAVVLGGCGDAPAAPETPRAADRVANVDFVSGTDQELVAGRRSSLPFRVLATDADGRGVPGAEVTFSLAGPGGVLSQPRALADSTGVAETYLLDARSGDWTLTARSGAGEASATLAVARAPGAIEFEEASGAVGLPGLPHPDSLVRARLLDREGRPLAGAEVRFAGPPLLSRYVDTTDADGWASTVVRRSRMKADEGWVYAFVLGFAGVIERTARPVEPVARKVVLISVDGLRADAIERWAPPTLARMAREGAASTRARTVVPSLTTPAHLSLLSGVPPSDHGIYADELTFTEEMGSLEPLFLLAAREGTHARAFMSATGPLGSFEEAFQCRSAFGLDSLTLVEAGGAAVTEAAGPALADAEVELVFLHVPDPDQAGHAHGWESPEYGAAVLAADSAVADALADLDAATLVVVTSDHGGGGDWGPWQHGSDSEADVRIPLLLQGPGVVPGTDLGDASILDVAPTALWALGVEPPAAWPGTPLLRAFAERNPGLSGEW